MKIKLFNITRIIKRGDNIIVRVINKILFWTDHNLHKIFKREKIHKYNKIM